ncbi:hypothetical protein WJX73_001361 [Symbiochloris irregularis]|uniref:protein-tyrosine-phosphatase n=1 Tax=Symbiochloris irregularis TaxID=706552 RepID=A0AAW1PLB8_9CHLO
MEVKSASAEDVFQVYTALFTDPKTYVLDLRPQKEFRTLHMLQAYSVRLSANGRAVLDYSKNEYHHPWSQDCWWDKRVLIYGDDSDHKASKKHPVVAFLSKDNRAKSLAIFKPGFAVLKEAFPFLCTASIKANASKRFPAAIVPGLLYLGGWDAAEDGERQQELNIRRIVTVHNNPENLRPGARIQHLRYSLADVDTEDIAALFSPCHQYIEQARSAKHAVLVHCGAGASRSATLCIAYLMKSRGWTAEQARQHCVARRSVVAPNPGFWRALLTYEQQLGLSERNDPATGSEPAQGNGADEGVAAQVPRVAVSFMPAEAGSKRDRDAAAAGSAGVVDPHPPSSKRTRLEEADRSTGRDRREAARPQESRGDGQDSKHVAGLTLEVCREGKVLGQLLLGLKAQHQRAVIGRDATPGACDVVLEHASVSRRHAHLTAESTGGVSLTDLGSAHGTNVDGLWLRPNAPKQLRVGSILRFGGSTRFYEVKTLPLQQAVAGQ